MHTGESRLTHINHLTSGNNLANETATTIPNMKKFLDTKASVFSIVDADDVSEPPRTASPRIVSFDRLSSKEDEDDEYR